MTVPRNDVLPGTPRNSLADPVEPAVAPRVGSRRMGDVCVLVSAPIEFSAPTGHCRYAAVRLKCLVSWHFVEICWRRQPQRGSNPCLHLERVARPIIATCDVTPITALNRDFIRHWLTPTYPQRHGFRARSRTDRARRGSLETLSAATAGGTVSLPGGTARGRRASSPRESCPDTRQSQRACPRLPRATAR